MKRLYVLFLALSLPALAQQEDRWWEIYMGRTRAGYIHETAEKTADGWKTVREEKVSMNRGGSVVEVAARSEETESADLRPLSLAEHDVEGSQPQDTVGRIDGGKLKLTVTRAGQSRDLEVAWDADALFAQGIHALQKKQGFAAGTKYSYKTYDASEGQFLTTEVEFTGDADVEVGGRKVHAHHAKEKLLPMEWDDEEWLDDDGVSLKSRIPVMMDMTTVLSTKEKALAARTGELADLMQALSPMANAVVAHPRRVSEALFEIGLSGGDATTLQLPGANQSVEKKGDGKIRLRVKNGPAKGGATRPVASTPELEPYLRDNSFMQVSDPAIQAAAKEAVGDEKDALRAAKKIEAWVCQYITKKDMDVPFATASEVMKTREGDCKMHALLLGAVARAAGIPAKVCVGFLYVNGRFGGHAWTSVWTGEWVDLDATLAGDWTDAMRIKFGESDLNGVGMAEVMKGMYKALTGLNVAIVEVVRDGKTEAIDPQAQWFSVDGGRLRHSLGFSFDLNGLKVVPRESLPMLAVAKLAGKGEKDDITILYEDAAAGRPLDKFDAGNQKRVACVPLDDSSRIFFLASNDDMAEAMAKVVGSLKVGR